jgi:hypothetical protein
MDAQAYGKHQVYGRPGLFTVGHFGNAELRQIVTSGLSEADSEHVIGVGLRCDSLMQCDTSGSMYAGGNDQLAGTR